MLHCKNEETATKDELRGTVEVLGKRPGQTRHVSSPYPSSPLRHHQRHVSTPHEVKETLRARSEHRQYNDAKDDEDDDEANDVCRINQYVIKREIGRGSFGAVHLAQDHNGFEYAIKEFSKSRLRRQAQSKYLRRPHAARQHDSIRANDLVNRRPFKLDKNRSEAGLSDPLYLIREEIAIMKKLNHDNLVSLFEVLDDPDEDSIYMVLEMCHRGVVMKVDLNKRAKPYDNDRCRCWFRDLILGIEYLHAQGIVHRDIKPDNLLLTKDDVLKIVDFGVSEMFEKSTAMRTAKPAGSPAFLPPELCIANHGDVCGKAADIWSMGVTLYCLRFGHLPFERAGILALYEDIRTEELRFDDEIDLEPEFISLMQRMLEKDPAKRIDMTELRCHPWVTANGLDPLLYVEENTVDSITLPTDEEKNHAITGNLSNVATLISTAQKFKHNVLSTQLKDSCTLAEGLG